MLYSLCGVAFLCYPLLVFVIFHMEEPTLPVFIPFVDANTRIGYIITSCFHYSILYLASIGFGFVDSLFFNLVFNILTMSQLQCNQLSKLNEDLDTIKQSGSVIQRRMTNIITMHQEMEKYHFIQCIKINCNIFKIFTFRYIDIVNESYFLMIFTQIATTSLSTILVIYIIITVKY